MRERCDVTVAVGRTGRSPLRPRAVRDFPTPRTPPCHGPTLLVFLGDYLSLAGQKDEALLAYRKAVDDGGPAIIDARAVLAWALFDADRADEGERLLTDLRRSKSAEVQTYSFVGELYETHDDLGAALRWFTAGLTRAVRADGVRLDEVETAHDASLLSETTYLLLSGRRRVRQAQGFPEDELDAVAVERQHEIAEDVEAARGRRAW